MYTLDISKPITCFMMGRMKQKNGWEFQGVRKIKHNLFVFIIDGTADFSVESHIYSLKKGDVFIIPEETSYFANTKGSCEYFFFHFSGHMEKGDMPVKPVIEPIPFSFCLTPCMHDKIPVQPQITTGGLFSFLFSQILLCMEYNANSTHVSRLLLDTEFLKILLLMSELSEKPTASYPKSLQNMLVYIKKNLTTPIRLSEISENCHISAPYAARLFKKYINMTVTEYVHRQKLQYALELMENTSLNLTEIADYLGFYDVFCFSRLFKKIYRVAPSIYLKNSISHK